MTMADTIKTQNPTPEFSRIVKVSNLRNTANHSFHETASEAELVNLAKLYDVVSVRKMRFEGEIAPFEDDGWVLEGKLGASISQKCVITLEPVRTRIDIDVRRVFVPMPDQEEAEISLDVADDDETEPLGREIDLGLLAIEALALTIPEYPRIEGAALPEVNFAAPGVAPISDEDAKPFAGLAALKEKLSNPDE